MLSPAPALHFSFIFCRRSLGFGGILGVCNLPSSCMGQNDEQCHRSCWCSTLALCFMASQHTIFAKLSKSSVHGKFVPAGSCETAARPSLVITSPFESKRTSDGMPCTWAKQVSVHGWGGTRDALLELLVQLRRDFLTNQKRRM